MREVPLHDVGHLARVLRAEGHAEVAAVGEPRDGHEELQVREGLGEHQQRRAQRPLEVGALRLGERLVGAEHADGFLHTAWCDVRGGVAVGLPWVDIDIENR